MASNSKKGPNFVDLWSEIVASEQQQQSQDEVIYRRRTSTRNSAKTPEDLVASKDLRSEGDENRNRLSLAAPNPTKRISWNRSLSTRGRTSIAVGYCVADRPQVKQAKKRGKPPLPKGKKPPNFDKERLYFEEVDSFELIEESPSPKNYGTWVKPNQGDEVSIPQLTSKLHNWFYRRLNQSCGPSSTLSKILGTPIPLTPMEGENYQFSLETVTPMIQSNSLPHHHVGGTSKGRLASGSILEKDGSQLQKLSEDLVNEHPEDLEFAVKKLSLGSASSFENDHFNFATLLAVCGQSVPSKFHEVFSNYCDPKKITKIGEGTFGEAFMAGSYVCKIVPIDGDFRVNGEVQKRSVELLEEVVLSRTLNCLRQSKEDSRNACMGFIDTIDLRVCQGSYDANLIRAWQDWDEKHGSENDHPKEFPDKQCYVVFVLAHGGKDLEGFVLLNFNEARTLLVQVTAALAVAEAEYEFEHRDLHWGNVLLRRNDSVTLPFTLEGKKMSVKTFGLTVQIIDFTLSRINTGEDILFLDLSSDPYLFKGPKGDKQSETYRKMKEVTEDCWEGSFPRTNVLWLVYLVDILLLKKSFERVSKNERDLRSLKKRLDNYHSAREAILDPFFGELIVHDVE